MISEVHQSGSLQGTFDLAAAFATRLRPGDFVALEGDLGAGKTQFVKGLVRGLGGDVRQVSSPTFVLMNIYQTPTLRVFHLDAYRVSGEEDLEAIGFEELLDQQGVVVVEWWQRVRGIIPADRWLVRIESLSPKRRRFHIEHP